MCLLKHVATVFLCFFSLYSTANSDTPGPHCPDAANITLRHLHSAKTSNLCQYFETKQPVLIVNTASHCGYTKQFKGLEELHQRYKKQGLVVLGFPSNSFKQEEADEKNVARVCFENFGVTFPMFETNDVLGAHAIPLFKFLAEQTEAPSWNFNKYLVQNGQVTHFGSRVKPLNSPLESQIKKALQEK